MRAGRTVRFTVAVGASGAAVPGVRVCDVPPRGMVFAAAAGARFSAGRACWKVPLLRAGQRRTFEVLARVEVDARRSLTNRATASASGVATRRARASVRTQRVRATRGGGVTG